jgi:hypothetical protein
MDLLQQIAGSYAKKVDWDQHNGAGEVQADALMDGKRAWVMLLGQLGQGREVSAQTRKRLQRH